MTTTTTVNVQRQCAHALMHILDVPGLAEATWYLHPGSLGGELYGQLLTQPSLADCHAAIDAYVLALGLSPQPEHYIPGGSRGGSGFTKVYADGEYMGASVRVWAAATEGATS